MPTWERTAQDAAEAEHPPPKVPQDRRSFRPAWRPALIVLLIAAVVMVLVPILFAVDYL